MVSRRPPNPVRKGRPAQIPALHSPLEKTPHKAGNGELSISCRNWHCPKCQAGARDRWLAARRQELLPTRYVHVVFTLPRELASLALQNKKVIYDLLFRSSAETLLEVARDSKHLGAQIGFFSVLHTWSQKLELHPHVHCVVPAGGLSADHTHWIKTRYAFLLPVKVLSRVFRGKFVAALKRAFCDGRLRFHGDLTPLAQPKTFSSWLRRDSAHNNEQKLMTLVLDEFLRRFLLHLLPDGFVRIRNFGFLANRKRATNLPLCFRLLGSPATPSAEQDTSGACNASDLWLCPKCAGPMVVVERLTAAEMQLRSPPVVTAAA